MILNWDQNSKTLKLENDEYTLASFYNLETVLRVFAGGGSLQLADGSALAIKKPGTVATVSVNNNVITYNGTNYNATINLPLEAVIRILTNGGAIKLDTGEHLLHYEATATGGGGAISPGTANVDQAWKYDWDNLRQHGERNDQWTVITEDTCRIVKNNGSDPWESFKITDWLKPGNYKLLTPWRWNPNNNPGQWINGTTFEIAEDGTITFNTTKLEGEAEFTQATENDLASLMSAIDNNPKFFEEHFHINNNNHFYLYPDDSDQVSTKISTIPFKQYKVNVAGTERIWNA